MFFARVQETHLT